MRDGNLAAEKASQADVVKIYLKNMELRHIRYFLAVAHERNFTRAAAELNVSQPPLSRQIRDLEKELGVRLFDRNSSHVALSPAGSYLAGEFTRIMEEIAGAAANARALCDPENAPLRIACVNSHVSALLPSLLEYASARLEGRKVNVLTMPTEAQRSALHAGSIDLGIVRSWKAFPGFGFETLIQEPFAIVHPEAWTRGGRPNAVLDELSGRPMAIISGAPGLSGFARKACAARGFEPRIVFESADLQALLKLVAASLAWSIVPALSFACAEPVPGAEKKAFQATMMDEATEVGFCWKGERPGSVAADFVGIAREYVRGRFPAMLPVPVGGGKDPGRRE
jgi:LysR family transcriptional regulator, benzoate and cis,cis-muconate-responsive activator of ben and cat genes